MLRKLGNICSGHKIFLNKIRNIFCVPDTKVGSATNVTRAGKRGNICVGNNVSSFARALRSLKPWPNGPASARKLNLSRDLRWVVKRTRKFPHKYTQVAKNTF